VRAPCTTRDIFKRQMGSQAKKKKSMKKEACTFVLHAITIMGTYKVADSRWCQV
jgi:hypothetical protein